MTDLTSLSDADLMTMLQAPPAAPAGLSAMSDADLMAALGKPPEPVAVAPEGPAGSTLYHSTLGARQGLTANFGDEIIAGLTTPIEMAIGAYKGTDAGKGIGQRIGDAYSRSLEQERGLVKQAETASPIATTVGNVAGGLATAGTLAKGGATLLKGAPTTRGMIAQGAGEGALYGAAYGAGEGEGGMDRLQKAASGAAVGGLLGGAVGAVGGAQANRAASKTIPELGDIRAMKDAAYAKSEAAGLILKPAPIQRFASQAKEELTQFGYLPRNQPKVGAVLDEIEATALNNNTLKGVDQLRQNVASLAKDQDAKTRELGVRLLNKLDDTIEKLNMSDVIVGNKTQGVESLLEARKLNTMMRKTETIEDAIERATNNAAASGSGGNIDNALRQQFRSILNDVRKRRGFGPDEVEAMRTIVRGTTPQNLARLVGKLSPSGNGLMLLLHGTSGVATGGATIPLAIAGAGAKAVADRATPRNIEALSQLVRSGGKPPVPQLTDAQLAFYRAMIEQGGALPSTVP